MTDCPTGLMRDQLPEYVHGVQSAADAARVAAHLEGCGDCRDEVALLATVRADAEGRTPLIDVAAIVSALPRPSAVTARPAGGRIRVTRAWQFAAAATLVLAVGSSVVWQRSPEGATQRVADSSQVLPTPASTAPVAAAAEQVAPTEGMMFGGGLSDLSLNDLESLLGQMDSVRTLPSSQPESMTPVIAVKEGGKAL